MKCVFGGPRTLLTSKNGPKHDIIMTTLDGHRQEQLDEQVASTTCQSLDASFRILEKQSVFVMSALFCSLLAVSPCMDRW
jgi:hypothetical protein